MRKSASVPHCHETSKHSHPCHHDQIKRINRVAGQLEGVKKMIQDQRYCPEILTQIKAATSALKSLEAAILETHLQSCVQDTMATGNELDRKRKVKELMDIFRSTSN